jgi:hypothetical protein
MLISAISNFFHVKNPFKKDDVQQKKLYTIPWSFDCEKSLALLTCKECLVQTSCFTFWVLKWSSFLNTILSRKYSL